MTDMRSRALWTRIQTMRTSTMVAVGILVVLMIIFYIKDSKYRERVSKETKTHIRKLETDFVASQNDAKKSLKMKNKIKFAESEDNDDDQNTFTTEAVTTTTHNPSLSTTLYQDSDDQSEEELEILQYKQIAKDKKISKEVIEDSDDGDDTTTTLPTPTTTKGSTTTEKTNEDTDDDDNEEEEEKVNVDHKMNPKIIVKKSHDKNEHETVKTKQESNNNRLKKEVESNKQNDENIEKRKGLINIFAAETKLLDLKDNPQMKQLPETEKNIPGNALKSKPLLKLELPENVVKDSGIRTDKNEKIGNTAEQHISYENKEPKVQKEVKPLVQVEMKIQPNLPQQDIEKKSENDMHEPITPKVDNNNDIATQIKMLALKYSITLNETDLPRQSETYTKRLRNKLIQTGRFDLLEGKNCKKRLPKCIIIGVMKAGTEAFSTFLGVHPQVAMQFGYAAMVFFSSSQYANGLEWYRERMMCSTKDQITMEKSPQYFSSPLAPKRIHSMDPDMKLILLVRDPISRTLSHFLQQKSANPDRLKAQTFEDCVYDKKTRTVITNSPYIQQSTYSVILKHWLQYFSLKQILIVDGDIFRKNPIRSLHKAETFLDIDHSISKDRLYFNKEKGFYCLKINSTAKEDLEMSCFGSEKGRIHPPIEPEVEKALQKYFKPYNSELTKMTNMKMNW